MKNEGKKEKKRRVRLTKKMRKMKKIEYGEVCAEIRKPVPM